MVDADDDDASGDSLATPRPFEDDTIPPPGIQRVTLAEQQYAAEGRTLKALAVLSLGLKNNDGMPTFDPSVLPWSAALKASSLKMTAKELRAEINRRSIAAENGPRPNQWSVPKATEWLMANPIVAVADVAFIRATIAHRISVAERSNIAQPGAISAPPPAVMSKGRPWVQKYPYLRLIHAVVDDNVIKAAYIRRLQVPSGRMAVENRRTPAAIASNVWHMVSDKWNDESFSPTTSVKETHSDFARPISIPFEVVSQFQMATPEKVEEKWNQMNLALKRCIQNWERSGQGDGGHTGDDDGEDGNDGDDGINEEDENSNDDVTNFGNLKGRAQRALDLRRNFFDDKNTYLLYLWDILDEHDLVQSSMQQLVHGIGSGDGAAGVPSVVGTEKHSRTDDNDSLASSKKSKRDDATVFAPLSNSIEKHSESIVNAAKMAADEQAKNRRDARIEQNKSRVETRISKLEERVDALEDKRREMALRLTEPHIIGNQGSVEIIQSEIQRIEADIELKKGQLNALQATPTKNNCSPKICD